MRDPEKVKKEMEEKDRKILETAFRIFVEKKIEPVSMGEIAKEAGVGRATVFRHYQNKLELVIAVCTAQWQAYFDKLDEERPLSSIVDVPAIERFIFTLDSYIDMYQNHKDLLQYNDNFNYYVSHMGVTRDNEHLTEFYNALYSINTRLHMMYEKAKADHSFRTDIPEQEFIRVTIHTMVAACEYYADGFVWGSEENRDYTPELLILKEMILNYVRN